MKARCADGLPLEFRARVRQRRRAVGRRAGHAAPVCHLRGHRLEQILFYRYWVHCLPVQHGIGLSIHAGE